jgi:hypothetical protein
MKTPHEDFGAVIIAAVAVIAISVGVSTYVHPQNQSHQSGWVLGSYMLPENESTSGMADFLKILGEVHESDTDHRINSSK